MLKLDNNEISELPVEIGNITNLEQLTLSSNKLKTLPKTISNLKKLQLLDIRKNSNLRTLPSLHQNKCLKTLLLDEKTEWQYPPSDVIRSGCDAILSYFRKGKYIIIEMEKNE